MAIVNKPLWKVLSAFQGGVEKRQVSCDGTRIKVCVYLCVKITRDFAEIINNKY